MFAFVRRRLPVFITVLLCLSTPAVRAGSVETPFTHSLSAADQAAIGLTKLSEEQRAALNGQIAVELSLARQGDVVAFAKSFSERRNPGQISATGLSLLSTTERAQLDVLIARAVAQRPAAASYRRPATKPADDAIETVTYRPQLHGEVSLTYGMASGGRNFYGGSFTTIYDDPAHHLTVAFTYSEFHGKGLLPFDGCGPVVGGIR